MTSSEKNRSNYITNELEPYIEGGKQPGRRKPYAPEIKVDAESASANIGTMGNGLFLGVDEFHEEEGRWPSAEEITKLSDWLDIPEGDDFEGVRIRDDGRTALHGKRVRLVKQLSSRVSRQTTMGTNDTHGKQHLDRMEMMARTHMTSADGVEEVTKRGKDGKTYLDKEALKRVEKQCADDRSLQDVERPPQKNTHCANNLLTVQLGASTSAGVH